VERTCAASLFAQLFPQTGEIRLQNRDPFLPVSIVFYSIESASGALNSSPNVWRSITTTYDAPFGSSPGNGLVDPNGEWVKISSVSTELAEGALDADGGRILPQRSISLGRVWNLAATPDFVFTATALDGQPIDVAPVLAVDGDYLPDGVVNQFDYQLWRQFFGSTTVLLADGNLNGIVDVADYVLWRNNFSARVPGLAAHASSAAILPIVPVTAAIAEPASGSLALCAMAVLAFRRHRGCCISA
jgi:hypothetical protein